MSLSKIIYILIHLLIESIKYYDTNINIDALNQTLNVIFQIINKENSYSNISLTSNIIYVPLSYLFLLFIIFYHLSPKNSANLLNKINIFFCVYSKVYISNYSNFSIIIHIILSIFMRTKKTTHDKIISCEVCTIYT